MRGLIYDGQTVRLSAGHPPPAIAPGQALVRLRCGAVSGLDLEVCRGLCNYKGVLGQHYVGTVESIDGSNRQAAALVGARVVGSPIETCGKCDMCQVGFSEHCRTRSIMGFSGAGGSLAEHFIVPIGNLAIVPEAVDDDHAVFWLELASALQASRRLTIEHRPYITVLGDNSLALLMVQVMSKLNATVRLVGADHQRLAICEKWSVKHRHQDEIGRRGDQDIVVECTGVPRQLNLATEMVRPRGTIVMAAISAVPEPVTLQRVVLNELQLFGMFAHAPLMDALAVLARREIDVVSLISRRMSLNDGAAIMKAAAQPGVVKVLVEP